MTKVHKNIDGTYPPHSADKEFPSRPASRFDSSNYNSISPSCQTAVMDTFSEASELSKKFTPKKNLSLLLADSYWRQSLVNKGNRVFSCGTFLEFAHEVSDLGEIMPDGKLIVANFCKDRLCPMCSWRRSYKIFAQVSQIMEVIHSDYQFLFLTLTVPNVKADELNDTITRLMESWHRFVNVKAIKKIMKGYFRALEVTYNKTADTFHPHFHVVIATFKGYATSRDYINHSDFLNIWRKAYKDDSITQVDIRVARNKATSAMESAVADLQSVVAEIAKYSVKSSDYIFPEDTTMTDYLVRTFSAALFHRRLIQFGGIFKEIFRQLNLDDAESDDADLVNVNGNLNPELAWHIVRYEWGIGCYNHTHTKLELPAEHNKKRGVYNGKI